ncbi:hypothetical protein DFJ74DRAFT_705959 [Hyaloraphidium curvatum]|nr:hypothetical protein DFJ74DRAFT_705959 [Hyaloraphidium curvatum]
MSSPPSFFSASGVAFDPVLPAGLPQLPADAVPAARPTVLGGAHVEHPHHFVHASHAGAKHGHPPGGSGHVAGPGQPSPGSSPPRHAHHPPLVNHAHRTLTLHLQQRHRAEERALERESRNDLVRERRGVRGVAEPLSATLPRRMPSPPPAIGDPFARLSHSLHSARRFSAGPPALVLTPPSPDAPRPRERRRSLPPDFSFPLMSPTSPVLATPRDAATLFDIPERRPPPAQHHEHAKRGDAGRMLAALFRGPREREHMARRGLGGTSMDLDEGGDGVMSVEFAGGGMTREQALQAVDRLIQTHLILPRLLSLHPALASHLSSGTRLLLPDMTPLLLDRVPPDALPEVPLLIPSPQVGPGGELVLPQLEACVPAEVLERLRGLAWEALAAGVA